MKIRKTYISQTIYDFINENNLSKLNVAYHVTRKENLPSIFEKGLEPRIPTDYGPDGDIKGVYLFKTLSDTKNALYNWLGERIEDWEEENDQDYNEVVLEINIDGLENHLLDTVEYEWTCIVTIEPERILNIIEV